MSRVIVQGLSILMFVLGIFALVVSDRLIVFRVIVNNTVVNRYWLP